MIPIGQERFCIHWQVQQHNAGAALFKDGGNGFARPCRRDGKAHKRGRYVELVERAGHAVLPADGRHVEVQLCGQRAEQSRRRLAPAFRLIMQSLKILLHGEPGGKGLRANHSELCQRFRHRVRRTMEGAPAAQSRNKAIAHGGGGVRFPL